MPTDNGVMSRAVTSDKYEKVFIFRAELADRK